MCDCGVWLCVCVCRVFDLMLWLTNHCNWQTNTFDHWKITHLQLINETGSEWCLIVIAMIYLCMHISLFCVVIIYWCDHWLVLTFVHTLDIYAHTFATDKTEKAVSDVMCEIMIEWSLYMNLCDGCECFLSLMWVIDWFGWSLWLWLWLVHTYTHICAHVYTVDIHTHTFAPGKRSST